MVVSLEASTYFCQHSSGLGINIYFVIFMSGWTRRQESGWLCPYVMTSWCLGPHHPCYSQMFIPSLSTKHMKFLTYTVLWSMTRTIGFNSNASRIILLDLPITKYEVYIALFNSAWTTCGDRFSPSPATGLVGMKENAFLSDFFGSLRFLPFTSQR